MTICDMKRGASAVVLLVNEVDAVRERLRVLGIYMGARVRLIKTSFRKRTYLLQTQSCRVALGSDVAERVRIWTTG